MSGNSEMKQYELYSSVVVRNVDWLWYPYLPYGKLSIIQGDPGCGKSTLMMHLIACITSGKSLPNGTIIQPHNVIYQCSEDSMENRLLVMGHLKAREYSAGFLAVVPIMLIAC